MWFIMLAASSAYAHKPWVAAPPEYTSAPDAFVSQEPDVSIVVYAERDCAAPRLWVAGDLEAGQEWFVQLGLPQADVLAGWRPSLAVVAEGLPQVDLGFPLPEGHGAVVFEGADEPAAFEEPFTGTSDWILVEERVTAPVSGRAYVVAWDPAGAAGRLWIATGERESFTSEDWQRIRDLLDDVRDFHGLEGEPVPAPVACTLPEEDADAGADSPDAASGCAVAPGRWPGLVALLVACATAFSRRGRRA
jgi:hypothetical protein